MKRTVHIAKNYKEAEQWDIKQILEMSPEERQHSAAKIKKKVYGENNPDVRKSHHFQKSTE